MQSICGICFLAFFSCFSAGFCAQHEFFSQANSIVYKGISSCLPSLYLLTSFRFCSSSGKRVTTRIMLNSSRTNDFAHIHSISHTTSNLTKSHIKKRLPLAISWDLESIPPPPPFPHDVSNQKKVTPAITQNVAEPWIDSILPPAEVILTEIPPPPETKEKKIKQKKAPSQITDKLLLTPELITNKPVKPTLPNLCVLSIQNFCQLFGRYVVLDTEFTGLGKDDRVTEIGCVELKNFQATGRKFSSLVNPQKQVRPSAHKLTGYTQKFLSKYPIFKTIATRFLEFLEDSPIIIHHADSDLYFLNKELAPLGVQHLEGQHEIIDTLRIAQNLYKGEKNNLDNLARRHGVDTFRRKMHGALIDAQLLAEIFATIVQQHGITSVFQKEHKKPKSDYSHTSNPNKTANKILANSRSIASSSFEAFFKEHKISLPLLPRLRYMQALYHPGTAKIYEALILDFSKIPETSSQLLVSYSIPEQDLESLKETPELPYAKAQYFFGDPYDALITLYQGGDEVIFIGALLSSLAARQVLLGEEQKELLRKLRIEHDRFSIKVLPSFHLADCMLFPKCTKVIYLLLENYDKDDKDTKNTLEKIIDKVCIKQYFCPSALLDKDWTRHILKYNQHDWIISEDVKNENSRNLKLIKPGSKEKATLILDIEEQTAILNGETINYPDRYILISSTPKITLRFAAFNFGPGGEFSCTQRLKDPNKFADRLPQALQLKTSRDIPFIEKCELARLIYENAIEINENSVAISYFRQRGINCALPTTFRYMHDVFHPMFERRFPVLLVPLIDKQSVMIGVHRIFFNHNGSQIKASQFPGRMEKRMPLKLSLGKTVGGYATVYHSSTKAKPIFSSNVNTVFVSEGVENALVIKDTLVNLQSNNHVMIQRIYQALNIDDEYDIRACVGINGIIDVPIPDSAKNVVILADNDAENIDTKRTLRETVEFFLKQSKKVFISLPLSSKGKLDFNDVYLRTYSNKKHTEIAHILCNSVIVDSHGLMGEDTEPLQETFERIKSIAANFSLEAPAYLPSTFSNILTFKEDRFASPSPTKETITDRKIVTGDQINDQYLGLMDSLQNFRAKNR